MRRDLIILGLSLMVGGMVLTLVFSDVGSMRGFNELFSILGFIGLILLIVGAVKGSGGAAMQQQQQVVVYPVGPLAAPAQAPAAPLAQLRCPTCGGLNEADGRFCQECGHAFPTGGAGPAKRTRKK